MIAAIFDILLNQTFLADMAGLIGVGLVGLGGIRLAERYHSINAPLMIWGAIALILGRLGILGFQSLSRSGALMEASSGVRWTALNLPMGLLTLGVGLIVAGFWYHERQVEAKFAEPGK